jgi:enoyl-CoA hydratase/carnithine racemase
LSSNSPAGRLLVDEPAPGVTRLTISNPERRGALDRAILDQLQHAFGSLDARCVVLTGEGSTFSAGYDIGDLPERTLQDDAERLIANPFEAALAAVDDYPNPTIAALNGHTIGGGLELALSCDLRIAADQVKLAMPPARLGLVYSHTGLRKFIDAIGAPRTRELFFTAARVDAVTAHAWGLVNAVVSGDQLPAAAVAMATEIAAHAPLSQRGNKRVIRAVLDARAELPPAVERELMDLRLASFASEDFREGIRAFAEKRAARWSGA